MFTDGLVLFLKLSFVVLELRSGLAWKHSTDVGNRIAQLILEKIVTPDVMEVEDLDATRTECGLSSRSFGFARLGKNGKATAIKKANPPKKDPKPGANPPRASLVLHASVPEFQVVENWHGAVDLE
ncbi:hypothetical protein POTOM_047349 [Populus tomentosa]|uniref:Uncharacterized protein n=1 Tax=Populus tomentosa TaxID=118781 RepID=A0A8X7YIK3_POPTO|nr:hypothetical protein POTOM_047349 [Populus tomentosa]